LAKRSQPSGLAKEASKPPKPADREHFIKVGSKEIEKKSPRKEKPVDFTEGYIVYPDF
jgi:hypothetical protein